LAKKIHAIRQDIPIILGTGNYDYIDAEKIREAGICHLLCKPLFLKNLSISIRAALEKA
jgi:two-component system, cell cycle sensor histidine kinase and response regulator CckA